MQKIVPFLVVERVWMCQWLYSGGLVCCTHTKNIHPQNRLHILPKFNFCWKYSIQNGWTPKIKNEVQRRTDSTKLRPLCPKNWHFLLIIQKGNRHGSPYFFSAFVFYTAWLNLIVLSDLTPSVNFICLAQNGKKKPPLLRQYRRDCLEQVGPCQQGSVPPTESENLPELWQYAFWIWPVFCRVSVILQQWWIQNFAKG